MWPNPQQTADLVTFTEEILDGKKLLIILKKNHFHRCFAHFVKNVSTRGFSGPNEGI